jgi:hypothetical protein
MARCNSPRNQMKEKDDSMEWKLTREAEVLVENLLK